jgi:hypothetical protein
MRYEVTPAERAYKASAYRLSLSAAAVLLALLALLIVIIEEHGRFGAAVRALLAHPDVLTADQTRVLLEAGGIPLSCALASYLLASVAVRLVRITLYLRRLHRHVAQRLTAAPLYMRGLLPRVQPPGQVESSPALRLLTVRGPVLLVGEAGAGKTTALLHLAYELSRRRAVVRVFFGRQPLPVLAPLTGYEAYLHPVSSSGADGAPRSPLPYLATQMARFGSPGLAARAPRLLRRGRILLLCDDLSHLPASNITAMRDELGALGPKRARRMETTRRAFLIVTCAAGAAEELGRGGPWQRWRLAPLTAHETLRVAHNVRPSIHPSLPGSVPRVTMSQLRQDLQRHRLDRALAIPAVLTAYMAARDAGRPLPYGRAELLQEAIEALCERAVKPLGTQRVGRVAQSVGEPTIPAARLLEVLGALASALGLADAYGVPLAPETQPGQALAAWLAEHKPHLPMQRRRSAPLTLPQDVAEACCRVALDAGILVVSSDGATLGFAHSLLEASFAASWMGAQDANDDGVAPLEVSILRPRFALPVILWVGAAAEPGQIATRMLSLSGTRKTLAMRAGLARAQAIKPTALALALASGVEGMAATLTRLTLETPADTAAAATHELPLRQVLDAVLAYLGQTPDPALTAAIRAIEAVAGDELAANIAYLAGRSALSRLARAELLSLLGLLASPQALAALVAHLAERDPTVRAGVNRGFALSGSAGVAALQRQLASDDEWMRTRARESLDSIDSASLSDNDTALHQAIRALGAHDPEQRAAAAETLGALHARAAVEPLIARLGDGDTRVRIAALTALGRLADPSALPALRQRLGHPDAEFRAALAEALGHYRDPDLIADLATLLTDSDSRVRTAAATALGLVGDDRALAALLDRRADPDPRTQSAVASALRRLGHM